MRINTLHINSKKKPKHAQYFFTYKLQQHQKLNMRIITLLLNSDVWNSIDALKYD